MTGFPVAPQIGMLLNVRPLPFCWCKINNAFCNWLLTGITRYRFIFVSSLSKATRFSRKLTFGQVRRRISPLRKSGTTTCYSSSSANCGTIRDKR